MAEEKKLKFNTGAVIREPGSTKKHKTGGWRSFKPIMDKTKCIECGICWKYCPDHAIKVKKAGEKEVFTIDYDYCKGCGICAKECPSKAISMKLEEK